MRIIPSIASQLASFDPSYGQHLRDALLHTNDAVCQTYRRQVDTLLVRPLEAAPRKSGLILLVLDALDECEERGMKVLLPHLITGINCIGPPVKVIVT
ncbi:hypothetical protein FRB96_003995, partial [Tulasnella sp. 330]